MPPRELSDNPSRRYPLQMNATYLATELPAHWPHDARPSSRAPSSFDACDQVRRLENDPRPPTDRFLLRSLTLNTTKPSSLWSSPRIPLYLNTVASDEDDSLDVSAFAERYLNMPTPAPVEVARTNNMCPINSALEQNGISSVEPVKPCLRSWLPSEQARLNTAFPTISEVSLPTRAIEYAHHPELPSLEVNAAQNDGHSQRQVLACYFCRGRKIACARPPPYSKNQTCNQCSRRGRECVYPPESRRGHHARVKGFVRREQAMKIPMLPTLK
ncbi:hypothetical protein R3P38DRAFT_3257662 [Favolaschia claudopus]|uniref:Zn(2)-C6 fungal-type domain-containing protein n=1 Tax=Favolaschia claudopus TaxID=2862362 RepID=A0AAW0D4A1_9AGAR